MSQNFKLYSQYYDLLYQDKDYQAEVDYLHQLINQYCPNNISILELGSGTGKHANLLVNKGYNMYGLERSAEMVAIANRAKAENITFKVADITDFQINQSFDVALSLFHVISYLVDNQSLISTFQNVHRHLNEKGLFIFDVWHSSAVNFQVPEKRTKTLQNEIIHVTRHANPIINTEQNIVEVNYSIEVKDLKDGKITNIDESHPMRYFSRPEIELLAYATGFEVIHSEEFLSKTIPSVETWGVCYILKKL
ncbi:Methyltransferase domain-containing protein [Pedobacter terrae]|uniref:Methyltransferase domain-containing protein n=1 Tax=Pedobacter terrae TaxID=405671 RepID=A0A1G7U5C5_9SPHI|nr:class I SAM-dependent methyltransferase [Pedobacter terrae]SDG41960.1 Methyltransferase domain-containing protein [Pedobacter terrae]